MKFVILSFVVALAAAQEFYDAKYDGINVEAIAGSPGALLSFNHCFLDSEPCDDAAEHFKKNMADVFQTACSKCTREQKYLMKRYLESLKKVSDSEYEAFLKKFDPENKYLAALQAAVV